MLRYRLRFTLNGAFRVSGGRYAAAPACFREFSLSLAGTVAPVEETRHYFPA